MKVKVRTDIETHPHFDVTFVQYRLEGKYDHLYIILSTLDNNPTDAWEDQGDSFLLVHLPKQQVLKQQVDYKQTILEHLPLLKWLDLAELSSYVKEKMQLS